MEEDGSWRLGLDSWRLAVGGVGCETNNRATAGKSTAEQLLAWAGIKGSRSQGGGGEKERGAGTQEQKESVKEEEAVIRRMQDARTWNSRRCRLRPANSARGRGGACVSQVVPSTFVWRWRLVGDQVPLRDREKSMRHMCRHRAPPVAKMTGPQGVAKSSSLPSSPDSRTRAGHSWPGPRGGHQGPARMHLCDVMSRCPEWPWGRRGGRGNGASLFNPFSDFSSHHRQDRSSALAWAQRHWLPDLRSSHTAISRPYPVG